MRWKIYSNDERSRPDDGGPDGGRVRDEWKLRFRLGGRGGRGRHGEHGHPFGFGGPFVPPGGPFGHPFGPRGLFRRGGRVKRGDVRAGILALLAEEPRNGYQIMQELENRSRGMWRPSPGSVYPALQLLEDEGLVRAEEGASGRVFALTDRGKQAAGAEREQAPWESAASAADDKSLELFGLAGQLGAAAMQVVQTGTAAQIAEARKALIAARRALYRLLADDPGEGE